MTYEDVPPQAFSSFLKLECDPPLSTFYSLIPLDSK